MHVECVANLVLAYVVYSLGSGTVSNVHTVMGSSFSEKEIKNAKDALWNTSVLEDKPRRTNSTLRSVKRG